VMTYAFVAEVKEKRGGDDANRTTAAVELIARDPRIGRDDHDVICIRYTWRYNDQCVTTSGETICSCRDSHVALNVVFMDPGDDRGANRPGLFGKRAKRAPDVTKGEISSRRAATDLKGDP